MLAKMGAAAVGAIVDGIKIVVGVATLIALIGWAKTHPDQAQALVTKLMDTVLALVNSLLTWLSTLGSN